VVVALGEKLDLSGPEVLGGLMIGYEVFAGISLSSDQKLLRGRGWHPTPLLGTMAAAGAAAKLLGLQEKEVIMSLGIAGSLASGLGQNFGTMVKPLHAGVSARNGLFAAQLAAAGVRADGGILEAPRGFGRAFFGPEGHSFEKIGQILGPPFKVVSPGINIKPYPCCRGAHHSIDAALVLHQRMKEMQVGLEQIESVACDLHLDGPTLHPIPRNGLEGKFSIAYCVTTALKQGRVGLEDFVDEKISDSVVQGLMKKTKNIRLPEKDYYVTIQLRDGRSFSHSVKVAKGDAGGNPLTDEEVSEKFKACARKTLSSRKIIHAVKQIGQMEKISHIRKFFAQIMTAS
jgi:2-methylcitrate dehydratase PrpD